MAPQVFAGKYVVSEEIAWGRIGIIYKALDRTLNRVVAIKMVHAHLSGDSSFVQRFLREARAMARLQHDNIVTIYAVEEERGTPLLVMEYFQGRNLRELTKNRPRLPLREIVKITEQLANALAFAHAHGIIHRDIKPANVMVDARGKAKLTDFGIAAALDEASITSAGQVIGTPEYMSPEQACGTKLDGRSDLYSVGILLYEMLTGATPYVEDSKTSILGKLAFDKQELTLTFPSDVPSLLQGVVRDLLRRQPEERIPDADILATQLHEILYTLPQTPPTTPLEESEPTMVLASPPPQADERTRAISPGWETGPTPLGSTEHRERSASAEAFPSREAYPAPQTPPRGGDETTVLPEWPHAPSPPISAPSSKWWQFWKRHDPPPPPAHNLPDQSEPGEPEPVLLGASAPSKVIQGQAFTARFVAYAQTTEEKVGKMLAGLGPDSSIHLALKTCHWKSGTDVVVHLSGQYLEVHCPTQTFKWEGKYNLLDFDVRVAANAPLGTTILKYDVAIHDVIVARVRLDIKVSHLPNSRMVRTASIYPAHTAFASYASEDKLRVLDRVAAVKISAGLDVWLDCLSLNPGEEWKSRLREEISQRDLFLLFWSRHAKESPWVSWEWHTALEEKGEPALQLHPLETPQEAPPPEELIHLHFGDPTILARKALEQQ